MNILQWFIYVGIAFLIIFGILLVWDRKSKLKFFCTILKWHREPKWQDSDGFDYYGKCSRCGGKIYQDKDGSWETRKEKKENE